METNREIISDLKGLVNIVNDGKEGYASASEATDSGELKAVFLKYSAQRAVLPTNLSSTSLCMAGIPRMIRVAF